MIGQVTGILQASQMTKTVTDPVAELPARAGGAKRSLVGLTRAELADAIAAAGIPERERKMRAQQIWHWI